MKTVISARDIEQLINSGGDLNSLPTDAIITPHPRKICCGILRTAVR